MKNRKKIILLIIIILIIAIAIGFYTNLFKNNTSKMQINIKGYEIDYKSREVNGCKDINNCDLEIESYPILNIDTDFDKIKKLEKEINDNIDDVYNNTINSSLDSPECLEAVNLYNYRYSANTNFYIYYDDNIVSITANTIVTDLCKRNVFASESFSNVYDANNGNILSNEEILQRYNYNYDMVLFNLKNKIENINFYNGTDFSIEDFYRDGDLQYKVYLDNSGLLRVNYICFKNGIYYDMDLRTIN